MKTCLFTLLALVSVFTAACGGPQPAQITIRGSVIRRDPDPNRQAPIAGVRITAQYGSGKAVTYSSVEGGFTITVPVRSLEITPVTLRFRHVEYEPLDELAAVASELYVVQMKPLPVPAPAVGPVQAITNVSVRYATDVAVTADVGTQVKTFQVSNRGNVPCNGQQPCSPDGRWKAALAVIGLDAERGNHFRNARLSCIAGPCPFTRIVRDDFLRGGQTVRATVLNWSDTVTFLLQAEVVHPMVSESVRRSYPVIFGRTMNFSLPGSAEGICIEAELNGAPIVFPLGPTLALNWADCHQQLEAGGSDLYRCELKPGFEFR